MAGRSCTSLLVACFLIFVSPTSFSQGQVARVQAIEREAESRASAHAAGLRTEFESYWWVDEGVRVRFPPIFLPKSPLPVRVGAPVLQQMAQAAGTIFSGTVTSVARVPQTNPQSLGTIAVTFHVEHAMRGVTSGQDLTIHEWMGLWTSGQRYRVGEHVLLFLFPQSKLGLTSPVGGAMGRFAIDTAGRVVIGPHIGGVKADHVLAGKSRVNYDDFARAVRWSSEEE